MARPQYPTGEGIWARGTRDEPGYENVSIGMPYAEAVDGFRRATAHREDFDPAAVFVWGTMQATGVLNILKDVEEEYGAAGQKLVRRALNRAGREAMEGLLADSEFPTDVDDIALTSFLITGINTVLYASLERPWITSDERCEFDILWCPHQDRYTAFDCRVQRYFVEGIIEAVEAAGLPPMTGWVEQLIPGGADCCHFVIEGRAGEGDNPWHLYSDRLADRALLKLQAAEGDA